MTAEDTEDPSAFTDRPAGTGTPPAGSGPTCGAPGISDLRSGVSGGGECGGAGSSQVPCDSRRPPTGCHRRLRATGIRDSTVQGSGGMTATRSFHAAASCPPTRGPHSRLLRVCTMLLSASEARAIPSGRMRRPGGWAADARSCAEAAPVVRARQGFYGGEPGGVLPQPAGCPGACNDAPRTTRRRPGRSLRQEAEG